MTMATTTKQALHAELLTALTATHATLRAAHADAREGATHDEAKPENDKDTRALEQSYLARGQAMRLEALAAGLAAVAGMSLEPTDVGAVGALVEAQDENGRALRYFLAPDGGGTRLAGGVLVLTPASPLGAALLGKRAGDDVEVVLGGAARQLVLVKVE